VADCNGVLHVTCSYVVDGVYYRSGSAWARKGGDVTNPSFIAYLNGQIYLAASNGVYVYSGSAWSLLGSSGYASHVSYIAGDLYKSDSYVNRWAGSSWSRVGSLTGCVMTKEVNGKLFAAASGGVYYWNTGLSIWEKIGTLSLVRWLEESDGIL
jgi:hypothetical protein